MAKPKASTAKLKAGNDILLTTLVNSVRSDLAAEIERRQEDPDWQPMFTIEELEFELNVRFADEIESGGGIKAYVIDLLCKGKQTNETAHKIKLKLKPLSSERTVNVAKDKADTSVLGAKPNH